MTTSSVILSLRYDLPNQQRSTLQQANHLYGHAQPSPDEIGGVLDFSDWQGEPVGISHFIGRWTLLYFGYSRCTGSCKTAIPLIVSTARQLRMNGLAANAAFVDIDAPPLGLRRLVVGDDRPMRHGPNWEKRFAMRRLATEHRHELMVLTGNRKQLSDAGIAYHVIREHVPPRSKEKGHSINHSSMIYFIAPDTAVAGYGYHDSSIAILSEAIVALSKAKTINAALGQSNRRLIGRGCAPTGLNALVSAPKG